MEACDFWSDRPGGSTDNTKFLVIKQNIETKLNESIHYCTSKPELRNNLDLRKVEWDELLSRKYIDIGEYRYCIMYIPYWMSGN